MTSRSAARRYARALFDVARAEQHDLEAIERDLSAFAQLISGNEALHRALANPAIPAPRKRAVVEQLLALHPFTPLVSNVLLLLAERDRLALLPDLAEAYQARLMEHRKIVRAEITTAVPVSGERLAALQEGLARATGRQVQVDVHVDPSIVGGAVARIGSTVYDGSVTTQLERMRQRLVEAEL